MQEVKDCHDKKKMIKLLRRTELFLKVIERSLLRSQRRCHIHGKVKMGKSVVWEKRIHAKAPQAKS